jgi:hypothetical protein
MSPETPLLTTEQRKRLIEREEKKGSEQEAYKKRHNDQVVLKKFGNYIDSIQDVLLILKHMPPKKIAKRLRLEHVPPILDLVETLLQQIDPWPVVEQKNGSPMVYKTVGIQGQKVGPGNCYIETMAWSANEQELAVNKRLKEHILKLQHYVDPYIIDPVCRDEEHPILEDEKIIKEMKEGIRSGFLSRVYFKTWTDHEGNIHREPVSITEDDLKFKRWNPVGLPRKNEIPDPEEGGSTHILS